MKYVGLVLAAAAMLGGCMAERVRSGTSGNSQNQNLDEALEKANTLIYAKYYCGAPGLADCDAKVASILDRTCEGAGCFNEAMKGVLGSPRSFDEGCNAGDPGAPDSGCGVAEFPTVGQGAPLPDGRPVYLALFDRGHVYAYPLDGKNLDAPWGLFEVANVDRARFLDVYNVNGGTGGVLGAPISGVMACPVPDGADPFVTALHCDAEAKHVTEVRGGVPWIEFQSPASASRNVVCTYRLAFANGTFKDVRHMNGEQDGCPVVAF